MPLPDNPLDLISADLAVWADDLSTKIADAIKGGLSAPGAARLSEQQKLEYYTRQYFNPDGSPNYVGRMREIDRLGPEGFAETLREVLNAHPEFRTPGQAPTASVPMPSGPIAPDGLPTEPSVSVPMPTGPIAPDGLPTRI